MWLDDPLRRGLRALSVLLVSGALLVTTAAPAAASWDWTGDLSDYSQRSLQPEVAAAPDGSAVVVWLQDDGTNLRVRARRLSGTGTVGPLRTLSAAGQHAERPDVAVDHAGVATVVWQRAATGGVRIQTRKVLPDGTLTPVRTLSASGRDAAVPQVAVDPDGRATVAWRRSDGTVDRVQVIRLDAGGVPTGPAVTVSEPGLQAWAADVAVDPLGNALVVWAPYETGGARVRSVRLSAEGVVGQVRFHSPAGANAVDPQVEVDRTGVATLAYGLFDGSHYRVTAVRVGGASDRGTWTLSAAGQSAWNAQLATDASGTAVVAWQRPDGSTSRVESRRLTADGSVLPLRLLSPAGKQALAPHLDADDAGTAHVVWVQEEVGSAPDRVLARTVPPQGPMGPVRTLSTIRDAAEPRVVSTGDGTTTAAFTQFNGTTTHITASRDLP